MEGFLDTATQLCIDWGYWGLFLSAFVAGSIVPFSSEAVMVVLVRLGLDPAFCLLAAATGNTAVDTGYRTIATYLSGADAHAITDLAVDYVRAFIGHGIDAYSAAYPFESVYTSPKRLMMQEARDEVLAVYRSEGLDKLPTWKEAEDHIALELEFMAALGDRIVAAAEADDEAEVERLLATQRNFLADHLSSWVPLMTADLRRFAQCGLYQGLASLTDGFLQVEEEFFDEIFEDEGEGEGEATEDAAE